MNLLTKECPFVLVSSMFVTVSTLQFSLDKFHTLLIRRAVHYLPEETPRTMLMTFCDSLLLHLPVCNGASD